MLQRKEEDLTKRQAVERRALPKRIRAERKARDMMFRESLRISTNLDPDGERDKLKKVCFICICVECCITDFPPAFRFTIAVPRAREETLFARATTFRYQASETVGGAPGHRRRHRSVSYTVCAFDNTKS